MTKITSAAENKWICKNQWKSAFSQVWIFQCFHFSEGGVEWSWAKKN